MKEHEHTADHGPAAKPTPGEVARDAGSKQPVSKQPRTASNKLMRRVLRKQYLGRDTE